MKVYQRRNMLEVVTFMRDIFDKTPLEMVAFTLLQYEQLWSPGRELFTAYDDFVGLLGVSAKRARLSELTPDEIETDPIYAEALEISHRFRKAVSDIFLTPTSPIGELTIRFGVF